MKEDLSSLYYQAQIHSLSYEHEEALEIIERLLVMTNRGHDILRFKGNVLDFKTHSEVADDSISKEEAHKQYKEAYECYSESIQSKPNYVPSIIDIGDYYRCIENYDIALKYYDMAIKKLEKGVFGESLVDEIEEVFCAKIEVLKESGENKDIPECFAKSESLHPNSERIKNTYNLALKSDKKQRGESEYPSNS